MKRVLRRAARWFALLVIGCYAAAVSGILALRWVDPFTTGVHIQRRVEALLARERYQKRYTFVPLGRISTSLQRAVIAAEDTRFSSTAASTGRK